MWQNLSATKGAQRPDPEKIAADLFSRLDTSGQGYIEKSDLQSALDKISSGKSTSGTSSDASELFSALDTDADGKVTKEEFTDTLQKLHDTLEQQFQSSRMQTATQGGQSGGVGGTNGMGGMPPPPPQGNDQGFTKDQLSSQLQEAGSSGDSDRSTLISSIVQNFDAADTNGDGKVTAQEAMAYRQSTETSGSASGTSGSGSGDGAGTAAGGNSDAKAMMQIMKLMHAYMANNDTGALQSSLSVSA